MTAPPVDPDRLSVSRQPGSAKLLETRKAVIAGWNALADTLEAQGEFALGGAVRHFARRFPLY